ncbi:hypothetical protein [Massilia sp. S19_KUP03_FR1]|uniref:hypothetical protein n=1 Tax=Massilia sp. S19_KUP03_FR1 TaxID=3025503 RepID=UPI002FCDD143
MRSDQMPIGVPQSMSNEYVDIKIVRTSDNEVDLEYRSLTNFDLLLKAALKVDGSSSELVFFDRTFWTVSVDGRPATEADIDDLLTKTGLGFAAIPAERQLRITTR